MPMDRCRALAAACWTAVSGHVDSLIAELNVSLRSAAADAQEMGWRLIR